MNSQYNFKDYHFYELDLRSRVHELGLRSRVYGLDLRSRVFTKGTLLCLVGGHLDIICVFYLWFLIFNSTRSLGKVSRTVTDVISVVVRLSFFLMSGYYRHRFPRVSPVFYQGVTVTPSSVYSQCLLGCNFRTLSPFYVFPDTSNILFV